MMKKHSGMRPHDIVVLMKIAAKGQKPWYMKDLAYELGISGSEISESINRSMFAGLIREDKKNLLKSSTLEFLIHGLRYVYPQRPGAIVRGIVTAHSAPPINMQIQSQNDIYVWPYHEGNVRGQTIEPLHPNLPRACMEDPKLYELMALCDVLRVGRSRERSLAIDYLEKWL